MVRRISMWWRLWGLKSLHWLNRYLHRHPDLWLNEAFIPQFCHIFGQKSAKIKAVISNRCELSFAATDMTPLWGYFMNKWSKSTYQIVIQSCCITLKAFFITKEGRLSPPAGEAEYLNSLNHVDLYYLDFSFRRSEKVFINNGPPWSQAAADYHLQLQIWHPFGVVRKRLMNSWDPRF